MGIKDDPLCTFCTIDEETTFHLLWECSITKYFLNQFHHGCKVSPFYIDLSEKLFLFRLEAEKKYQPQ